MLSFFNRKTTAQLNPALANLDYVLYPLHWQHQLFDTVQHFLLYVLENLSFSPTSAVESGPETYLVASLKSYQQQFSQLLLQEEVYQDWINFTVFGRYVQRSFTAFYQQTEDVFNADMPDILKHELLRHTQRLPEGQVLLLGGRLAKSVRREKLLITTLNPFKAIENALKPIKKGSHMSGSVGTSMNPEPIINFITTRSDQVKAFVVKHNRRTSEGTRNEVMILDFNHLTLTQEQTHKSNAQPELSYLIRYYTIG